MDEVAPEPNEPRTLLVVDDVDENRDMLARRLHKKGGYTTLTAASGEEALARIAAGGVDLVLLDVMMPGMDGLEVLRRLREDAATAELPVIMVTAKDDGEDLDRAFELGADDHAGKPVDFEKLLPRVKRLLRRRASAASTSSPAATAGAGSSASSPASSSVAPGVGDVLAERYRLDGVLGTGNFGTVYRGHHLRLDRPVAVKILQTRIADPEALARFEIEGRSAVQVRHPNAVEVFDFDVANGIAFLVMELLEGEPLARELRRQGRLSPRRAEALVQPVCGVLAAAHAQGLVHRDVKPENIYLHRVAGTDGRHREIVKVLDFGIAKIVGEHVSRENLTAEGFVLGTPAFLAPERLRNQAYDGRSDVYSLGVVLYRMLAGRLPFLPDKDDPMALLMMHLKEEPPPPSRFAEDLPPSIEAIVLDCLAKDPNVRPRARELGERLARAVAALPPEIPSPGPPGVDDETPTDDGIDAEAPTHEIDARDARADAETRGGFFGRLVDRYFGSDDP